MYDFHKDKPIYFQYQYLTSKDYIIPFLKDVLKLDSNKRVLEIGCAEAGVLQAFVELDCTCVGIELSASRVSQAEKFHAKNIENGKITFITKNIYEIDIEKDIGEKFDLVILKDVIEHIPDQAIFIEKMRYFLKPNGVVFFGFPPWHMPFGGHQQTCKSNWLKYLPYWHLLPTFLFNRLMVWSGEEERTIRELCEIKETGIGIQKFERLIREFDYTIVKKKAYLFNPIYKYKFGLKVREQFWIFKNIPYFRDFVTTCMYYIIKQKSM